MPTQKSHSACCQAAGPPLRPRCPSHLHLPGVLVTHRAHCQAGPLAGLGGCVQKLWSWEGSARSLGRAASQGAGGAHCSWHFCLSQAPVLSGEVAGIAAWTWPSCRHLHVS